MKKIVVPVTAFFCRLQKIPYKKLKLFARFASYKHAAHCTATTHNVWYTHAIDLIDYSIIICSPCSKIALNSFSTDKYIKCCTIHNAGVNYFVTGCY